MCFHNHLAGGKFWACLDHVQRIILFVFLLYLQMKSHLVLLLQMVLSVIYVLSPVDFIPEGILLLAIWAFFIWFREFWKLTCCPVVCLSNKSHYRLLGWSDYSPHLLPPCVCSISFCTLFPSWRFLETPLHRWKFEPASEERRLEISQGIAENLMDSSSRQRCRATQFSLAI